MRKETPLEKERVQKREREKKKGSWNTIYKKKKGLTVAEMHEKMNTTNTQQLCSEKGTISLALEMSQEPKTEFKTQL